MTSVEKAIRELEERRKVLNERLMTSQTLADANSIERELWALRAAIRFYMRHVNENNPGQSAKRHYSVTLPKSDACQGTSA